MSSGVLRKKISGIGTATASKMIADPLHMLEIVMPVAGGHALVVTSAERARRTPHRPVVVAGCGERLTIKTPTYARDLLETPVGPAADKAFAMAGAARSTLPADNFGVRILGACFCSAGG